MGKKNIKIKKNSNQNDKHSKKKKIRKLTKIKKKNSKQLYDSICRIYDEKNKKSGTGFFMRIILENEPYYFLVTCRNIITSEQIDNKETIVIYLITNGKEEKRNITIVGRPHFVFFQPLNITIIGILDSDNISKDRFLSPDLNYKEGFSRYNNKNYYMVGFENNNGKNKKFISSFITKNNFNFKFIHDINKGQEAFGSLICTKDNFKIIGINNESYLNYGTYIGRLLDLLENIRKGINQENYVSLYEGMIDMGLRHGKGTGYYSDGGIYKGDWINEAREGNGIMYYSNGNIYDGDWKNDRREGIGKFYFCTGGYYEGEFKNNIIDGYGKLKAGDGYIDLVFDGTLKIWGLDNPNFDVFDFLSH